MEKLIFLISIYNGLERGITIMALEDVGTPYFLKDYESGNHMRLLMGPSVYSCEIDIGLESYDRVAEVITIILGPGIFEKQEK